MRQYFIKSINFNHLDNTNSVILPQINSIPDKSVKSDLKKQFTNRSKFKEKNTSILIEQLLKF